jgi:predicted transcriptional regulator
MYTIPPITEKELYYQTRFSTALVRVLDTRADEDLNQRVRAILTNQGLSPKEHIWEMAPVTLSEFFEILEVVNDPKFVAEVLALPDLNPVKKDESLDQLVSLEPSTDLDLDFDLM